MIGSREYVRAHFGKCKDAPAPPGPAAAPGGAQAVRGGGRGGCQSGYALRPTDMMRNATIAASFAYLASNRDDKLPRKPLPGAASR